VDEEAAFLASIRADPEDGPTRLAYADWLEERGDARTEYLRLQVEAQRIAARARELGARLDRRWLRDVAPRPGSEVRLRAGGTIHCQSIRQSLTYAGLLEGLPTRQMNEGTIEGLLREERERGWWAGEPYLVPPAITPIEYSGERKYPFGDPEALPDVTCVARFAAYAGPGTTKLTVIWFQDEFAFPIAPDVLEHLAGIDWSARAILVED
jgi:uncharacterized protein (TIGR02996 family)